MMFLLFSIFAVSTLTTSPFVMFEASESDSYVRDRQLILRKEQTMFLGGKINLTDTEKKANDIILKIKQAELSRGHENISTFLAAEHFFDARKKIEQSEMFALIKTLPKGGSLHTHYLSAVSVDFIIENITYKDKIYGCDINGTFKLRFLERGNDDTSCAWKKLEDYRKEDPDFDVWLKKQLSLEVKNPREAYPTANSIWTKFKKTFNTQYDMVCYRPVFEEYIYRLLKELYADNVVYTELRGTIMPLYELNGTRYNNKEFMDIFVGTVERFKMDHPDFLGVRYIHSVYRGISPEDLKTNLRELVEIKNIHPDFIAGFDFVGYEEEGKTLFDYHEILLEFANHLKFYFHAGETNWFGSTDENLVDAVLLNSSRIGHGFGLNKHPVVAQMAREKNICVELCPISNQVLMLNEDPRNHPMIGLMASGFPVVVCNDDPSAWDATGLSYDWYVAFMAMTSENDGIRVLKKFAVNSILYSAMGAVEKTEALRKWEASWDAFLHSIVFKYKNY